MSSNSRIETNYGFVTPGHKALLRIHLIIDESALDEECHLWEIWQKLLKADSDFDRIRCPRCSPDHLASECIWVDTAWGFRDQRIRLAANVLEILKDIVFPIPSSHLMKLRSVFQQAISLEQEIDEIAGKLGWFRKIRGTGAVPTVWEILSSTFAEDLLGARNVAAHEPKSDDNTNSHEDNGDQGDLMNDRILETVTTTTDANQQPHFNNRSAGLVGCPYSGCDVTTNLGTMSLRRHFLHHTRSEGNFRCLRCPFVSTTLRALRSHGQSQHHLRPRGVPMLEMITVSSRRLETAFRAAQGLTGDDFPDKLWL